MAPTRRPSSEGVRVEEGNPPKFGAKPLYWTMSITVILIVGSIALSLNAFSPQSSYSSRQRISWLRQTKFQLHIQNHDGRAVDELLSATMISQDKKDTESIKSIMSALEKSYLADPSQSNIFTPLLGLYEVRTVITANPKDNPVGGKWTRSQKMFRTRATFQHLLPLNSTGHSQLRNDMAVAEAINIVSLDALNGLLRITVILRGDAIPLSSDERNQMNTNRTITPLTNLAVRAMFDPPRIYMGRRRRKRERGEEPCYSYFPLQIGPSSSVVLDTTYCDSKIRIGRGGTSGSYFLFVTTNTEEASEYKALMDLRTRTKRTIGKLAMLASVSLYSTLFGFAKVNKLGPSTTIMKTALWFLKRISIGATLTSGIALLLLLFSSGGIERDGVSQSQISGIVK